jgi:DNA helicase HerA-like ATPase
LHAFGSPSPITILDLSGIPSNVLTDLIGALVRIVYDALFWARKLPEGGRERPLLFVLEEAHAYLGKEHSGASANAVRRIAKEGRKYGVGVMIIVSVLRKLIHNTFAVWHHFRNEISK